MSQNRLRLFEAFGVELEYMLVDAETLDVRPVADRVLQDLGGRVSCDVELGPITWSNELTLHVLELKCSEPAQELSALPDLFQPAVRKLSEKLVGQGLRLLPTAMHPWMKPTAEARLWPHEYHEIYETYDRIFDCRTHGWANVQSVHLNLPFASEEEFARLHAAVRLVLPLLPALAASSPIVGASYTEFLDTRLHMYAHHCDVVPSLIGDLIPEAVYSEDEYRKQIMMPIVRDVAPLDTQRVMQADFLNARGAIARFDRGSVEIRVMDVQEFPGADIAICSVVVSLLKALCDENWSSLESQQRMSTQILRQILEDAGAGGETTVIRNSNFLSHFGVHQASMTAGALWEHLLSNLRSNDPGLEGIADPVLTIVRQGTLATRIKTALGQEFDRPRLKEVYCELAECLLDGRSFLP